MCKHNVFSLTNELFAYTTARRGIRLTRYAVMSFRLFHFGFLIFFFFFFSFCPTRKGRDRTHAAAAAAVEHFNLISAVGLNARARHVGEKFLSARRGRTFRPLFGFVARRPGRIAAPTRIRLARVRSERLTRRGFRDRRGQIKLN